MERNGAIQVRQRGRIFLTSSPKMCLRCGSKMDEVLVDLWRCMECDLGIDWNEYAGWRSAMTMDGDWIKDGGLLYSYSRRDYEREVPWGCLLVMNENL